MSHCYATARPLKQQSRNRSIETASGVHPPRTTSLEIPGTPASQLNWSPQVSGPTRNQIIQDGTVASQRLNQGNWVITRPSRPAPGRGGHRRHCGSAGTYGPSPSRPEQVCGSAVSGLAGRDAAAGAEAAASSRQSLHSPPPRTSPGASSLLLMPAPRGVAEVQLPEAGQARHLINEPAGERAWPTPRPDHGSGPRGPAPGSQWGQTSRELQFRQGRRYATIDVPLLLSPTLTVFTTRRDGALRGALGTCPSDSGGRPPPQHRLRGSGRRHGSGHLSVLCADKVGPSQLRRGRAGELDEGPAELRSSRG